MPKKKKNGKKKDAKLKKNKQKKHDAIAQTQAVGSNIRDAGVVLAGAVVGELAQGTVAKVARAVMDKVQNDDRLTRVNISVEDVVATAQDVFEDVKPSLHNAANEVKDALLDTASTSVGATKDAVSNVVKNIENSAIPQSQASGTQIIETLQDDAEHFLERAKASGDTARNVAKDIVQDVKTIKDATHKTVQDLVETVADRVKPSKKKKKKKK
jgi:phage-related protein